MLVTLSPLMYREAIALTFETQRPDFEVLIGSSHELNGIAPGFAPHMVIADDIGPAFRRSALCLIEVGYKDSMGAQITLGDETWRDEDLSTDTLLHIADRTRDMIPDGG